MWLQECCKMYGIDKLLVGIEYPVVKGRGGKINVTNYRKQASTIAVIELQLAHFGAHLLVEINPSEAKMAATGKGNATKLQVVAASPFRGTGPSIEAMADAWAIALAAKEQLGNAMTLPTATEWRPYMTYAREEL